MVRPLRIGATAPIDLALKPGAAPLPGLAFVEPEQPGGGQEPGGTPSFALDAILEPLAGEIVVASNSSYSLDARLDPLTADILLQGAPLELEISAALAPLAAEIVIHAQGIQTPAEVTVNAILGALAADIEIATSAIPASYSINGLMSPLAASIELVNPITPSINAPMTALQANILVTPAATLTIDAPMQRIESDILIDAGSIAGPDIDDWNARTTATGVRTRTRFDTHFEVHDYALRNGAYHNGGTSSTGPYVDLDLNPARLQWVGPTSWPTPSGPGGPHPNLNERVAGYTGCMKFNIDPTIGTGSVQWCRKLNEAFSGFSTGYGEGSQFWFYYRIKLKASWLLQQGNGVGPKIHIMNRPNAHNDIDEGQTFIGNGSYRGIVQGQADGGNYDHDPVCWYWYQSQTTPTAHGNGTGHTGRWIQQPALHHKTPWLHPMRGLFPPSGDRFAPTQAYDEWRYGGIEGTTYTSAHSGAVQYQRDMVDKWCGILTHIKIGTWGVANSIWECWWHGPGRDYLPEPMFSRNVRLFEHADEAIGGFINRAYGNSGTPIPVPPEGWPFNYLYILYQENNRNPTGGEPTKEHYIQEIICKDGPRGIEAPGHFSMGPPVSKQNLPTFLPAAGVRRALTTATNGRPTMFHANPAEWGGNAANVQTEHLLYNMPTIAPWCCPAWDRYKHTGWMWRGGGHSAGFNPNIYKLDLQGSTQMYGWDLEDQVPYSDAVADLNAAFNASTTLQWHGDRPASTHTYNGNCAGLDNRIWSAGGANCLTGHDHYLHRYTIGSHAESGHQSWDSGLTGSTPFGQGVLLDEWFNKLICLDSEEAQYRVFDVEAEQWVEGVQSMPARRQDGHGPPWCYDWTRRRLISAGVLSHSTTHRLGTFGSNYRLTFDATAIPYSGDTQFNSLIGPALCYHEARDRFYAMETAAPTAGSPNPNVGLFLWEIHPTTFNCVRHTLSGSDNISGAGSSYNRAPNRGFKNISSLHFWPNHIVCLNCAGNPPLLIGLPPNAA